MKTRNLHKIATFLIACLILACCLVARASAQELSTEQCGAWIEKTVDGITYMDWQEITPEEYDEYKISTLSGGDSIWHEGYFALSCSKTNPTFSDFPAKKYFRCLKGTNPNVFASGTLIRNNNHEILKHPHDAGYYLVWYQGTLYYE